MKKIASFFAGVGGIELGFEDVKIVYANEIDKNAALTYELNHNISVDVRDIRLVDETKLPKFDILTAGFPCQAFSVAGYQKGFNDERGNVFFELIRIIKHNMPKVIFLENVKNLTSHDKGKTFKIILNELESLGYSTKHQILNAMNYGNTPQNRERIYILGFKNKKDFLNFSFPNPCELTKNINDIASYDLKVDERYYYTKKCPFYELLKKDIVKENTIYQWRRKYVRENKSGVCPTLTANMGTGGHNVPLILSKYGIRKLTPKECFLFQGFNTEFKLPDIANTHLYKQAGNSVCVNVIKNITKGLSSTIL